MSVLNYQSDDNAMTNKANNYQVNEDWRLQYGHGSQLFIDVYVTLVLQLSSSNDFPPYNGYNVYQNEFSNITLM